MKSQYNFYADTEVVTLALHNAIHNAFVDGSRIVWNHKGMRGIIPTAILEAAYGLLSDYESRTRTLDEKPSWVGMVPWESTVRVPPHDPKSPDLIGGDA